MAETGGRTGSTGAPSSPGTRPGAGDSRPHADEELDVRRIVQFGAGLALTVAVVIGVVWALVAGLKSAHQSRDPRPSPLAEAGRAALPPEPRLQSSPGHDMSELRAREDAVLNGYAWVDRRAGIARIPVERAMRLLADTGLPDALPSPASSSAAATPRTPVQAEDGVEARR